MKRTFSFGKLLAVLLSVVLVTSLSGLTLAFGDDADTGASVALASDNLLDEGSNEEFENVDGLETAKSLTATADGYKITLEAWTTGEVTHATTGNKVDIILVLDMSKQMQTGNRLSQMKAAANSFIDSSITTDGSRRIAVVTYNNTAVVQTGGKADNDGALVQVTPDSAETMKQAITALSGPTGSSNIDQGLAKAAHIFQDGNSKVPSDRQRIVVLLSAGVFGSGNLIQVEGKDHNGRTTVRNNNIEDLRVGQRGLLIGSIIKTPRNQNAPVKDSQAYFQGEVTKSAFTSFFGSNFAGCGAELYCVGVGMPKAELGGATYGDFKANYKDGTAFWKNYGTLGTMINEVMYRMSSHRPDSSHVGGSQYNSWEQDWKGLMAANGYSTWPAPHGFWEGHYWDNYTRNLHDSFPDRCAVSYFITTDDAADLGGIFSTINENIGKVTLSLETSTVLKDVVTPYFDMPQIPEGGNAKSVVKVYTMDYNGSSFVESTKKDITNSVTVVMDEGSRTVSVSGYNYDDNYVTTEGRGTEGNLFYGRKLIVEFAVTVVEGFLGGNNVPTNEKSSGIYTAEGDPLGSFEPPKTDVPSPSEVEVTPRVNAHLGAFFLQEIELDDLKGVVDVGYAGVQLDLSKPDSNYGLDPEMSRFVTVSAGLLVENPKGSDTYVPTDRISDIREDLKYKLRVSVVPTEPGTFTGSSDEAGGKISVFYPELTFRDSGAYYYGEAVPAYDSETGASTHPLASCWVQTVWKNLEGKVAGTEGFEMSTKIPKLAIEIKALDGTTSLPKRDVPMDVDVTMVGYLNGESLNEYVTFHWEPCQPACGQSIASHEGSADSPEFFLHPQTCQLTVVKTGGEADTPHVFTVLRDGDPYTQLSITGNDSKTIYELPVGTYSIAEDTGWSWRSVSPTYSSTDVALSNASNSGVLTCTNALNRIYWLNGYAETKVNAFVPAANGQ